MMLVTILFGALAALFAALFFLQRANLRRACRELRQINQEGGTRRLASLLPGWRDGSPF